MAKALWSAHAAAPWQEAHQAAANTLQQHASEKLQELNRWYESELPAAIRGRAPQQHITQPELVQLVDWKLNRGKWRPRLLDYAKAAQDVDVVAASTKAFSILLEGQQQQQQQPAPSASAVQAALSALVVLKGVGPATASALLAAADGGGSTPFMSDEALEAAVGSRSYTAKEYMQLVEALRSKADWLRSQDPDGGWTAVKVEGCLFAADLANRKPAKPAKAAAAAAAGKGGSKAAAATAGGQQKKRPAGKAAAADKGGGGGKRSKQQS